MKQHAKIYRMVTSDHLCPWGIKAVYVEKRSLQCACVGGDSHVPGDRKRGQVGIHPDL